MRQANVKLENRIDALQQLQDAERELRAAVHEWFMREETELVVDIVEEGAGYTEYIPVILHWLRENEKYALHYWVFERVLGGELPRYLCGYCRDPKCGGAWACKKFVAEACESGMMEGELIDHERQVRMPVRVKKAILTVVQARGRVNQ